LKHPQGSLEQKKNALLSPSLSQLLCLSTLLVFSLFSLGSSTSQSAKRRRRNEEEEEKKKKKKREKETNSRAHRTRGGERGRKKNLRFSPSFLCVVVPTMAATAAAPPSASSPQQHGELRALDALELPEDLKAKVKEMESLSHPVLLNRQ
jgi:hypothetical protein